MIKIFVACAHPLLTPYCTLCLAFSQNKTRDTASLKVSKRVPYRKISHTTFNTGKDRDNLSLFICILWTVNKWIGKFGREEEEWCIYLIIPLLEAQVTYWGGGIS